MDPKALSNLDPKLRATYERVMGTPSPTPPQTTDLSTTAPDQITQASPTMAADATPPASDTTAAQTPVSPFSPPVQPINPWQTNQATPSPSVNPFTAPGQPLPSPASVTAEQAKETSPLLRVLYIVGAVVFFIIYTIFWIKVFKLPFLF